jgi:hypothetical protein
MSYSLLGFIDQVCGEMALVQPTIVIGNNGNQTLQMLALANRLGKDLTREFEWQKLVKAYILNTTAAQTATANTTSGSAVVTAISINTSNLAVGNVMTGLGMAPYTEILTIDSSSQVTMTQPATAAGTGVTLTFAKQDYAMPSDFDRMISDTNWDRTDHWRNLGTKSSQEWQWLQGGVISIGPRERYRIYNGNLRIFAALTSVFTFSFEYVSNQWVVASGGSAASKSAYSVDTDTSIFPDDLMLAGLKYYWLKAKKLDYGPELAEYNDIKSMCKAQDVPQPSRSMAPIELPELVGPWAIQDGNWPTTSS